MQTLSKSSTYSRGCFVWLSGSFTHLPSKACPLGAQRLQLVVSVFGIFSRYHGVVVLLIIQILVILVLHGAAGLRLFLGLLAFLLILGVLHLLLALLRGLDTFGRLLGQFYVVGDENVIENGARLDLPQIETDRSDLLAQIELGVGGIFGIVDFRVLPDSLEVGVVNLGKKNLNIVTRR